METHNKEANVERRNQNLEVKQESIDPRRVGPRHVLEDMGFQDQRASALKVRQGSGRKAGEQKVNIEARVDVHAVEKLGDVDRKQAIKEVADGAIHWRCACDVDAKHALPLEMYWCINRAGSREMSKN